MNNPTAKRVGTVIRRRFKADIDRLEKAIAYGRVFDAEPDWSTKAKLVWFDLELTTGTLLASQESALFDGGLLPPCPI